MRDFGKVAPSFWTGETGRKLRRNRDAQTVAMYLLTSPHANMIGVFHCPILYIAHETGLPLEGASEGLRSLIELDFCSYDGDLELVWVHEMAKHQVGEALKPSDNRVAGIAKDVEKLPNGLIKDGFYGRYADAFCLRSQPARKSPSEAPPKPLPSQEIETETEKDLDIVPSEGPNGTTTRQSRKAYPPDFEAVWKAYPHHPGRSSKPDSVAEWRKLPADEREALPACVERFRPNVETTCGGKGAPDMARWLKHGKHLPWMDAAQAVEGEDWPDSRWSVAVELWRTEGSWGERLGPRPGEPGCRVPPHLLITETLNGAAA